MTPSRSQTTRRCNRLLKVALLSLVSLAWLNAPARATNINFSSLETVLADGANQAAKNYALWVGWAHQIYEYNMPFVQLSVPANESRSVVEFRMTIGDTDYQFSNEYWNKQYTNSWNIPANGEHALLGATTPGFDVDSSIENSGDTLVVDFGSGGLQAGDTIRLQLDINPDPNSGAMVFQPYTSVFFQANGGPDVTGNSVVTITYDNGDTATVTLPNFAIDPSTLVSIDNPRPYPQMQMIDPITPFDIVPEPTAALLAIMGLTMPLASRRG